MKQINVGDKELLQLYKTCWVCQNVSVNATLQIVPALMQTSGISDLQHL